MLTYMTVFYPREAMSQMRPQLARLGIVATWWFCAVRDSFEGGPFLSALVNAAYYMHASADNERTEQTPADGCARHPVVAHTAGKRARPRPVATNAKLRASLKPSRRMRRDDIMRRAARVLGALACGISQVHGVQISTAWRCWPSPRPC